MRHGSVLAVLLALVGACGGSASGTGGAAGNGGAGGSGGHGGAGSGTDPFVGSYQCTETYTLDYTTPAGHAPSTGSTNLSATFADDGHGTGGTSTIMSAGATCMLTYSVSGDTATLSSGQTCTFNGVKFDYTTGTSSLSGKTASESYTFSWTEASASGTGTASLTCTKK